MSVDVRAWWERWGPWVGPSGVMLLLAAVTRLEACSATPWSAVDRMRQLDQRIENLEGRVSDQAAWRDEHQRVTEVRIGQLEQQDKELALLKLQAETSARDLADIKSTVEWIRRNMRVVGPPVRPGSWGGGASGGGQ